MAGDKERQNTDVKRHRITNELLWNWNVNSYVQIKLWIVTQKRPEVLLYSKKPALYTVSVLWDYYFFNNITNWQSILINWFLIQMAKCCKTNNMFNSSTFSSNKNSKNKRSTTKMGTAIPCIFLRDQIWWSKHKGQQKW